MEFPSNVKWVRLQAVSGADNEVSFSPDISYEEPETVCKKMLRSVRGIIFDFDGTIFDNAYIAIRLIAAYPPDILRVRGERLVRSHLAGKDFSSPENYHRAFFSELGKICLAKPERIQSWYFDRYMPRMVRVLRKHYKPRPGFEELLRRTQPTERAEQMAIYSDYPFLKERMAALGLFPSEKIRLYGPESFGAQKPAVRPFLQIAEDLRLPPEEILVIGDRENTDGLGAFNAGMHFFCLETGQKRYYRLDPNRRRPEEEAHGPTLLMYAGAWDRLIKMLMEK